MLKNKNKIIPNCLRKYRKCRGLKQAEVARILGLKTTDLISRWEHGYCLPEVGNVLKLAVLYRTFVDGLYIDLIHLLRKEILAREEKVIHHSIAK